MMLLGQCNVGGSDGMSMDEGDTNISCNFLLEKLVGKKAIAMWRRWEVSNLRTTDADDEGEWNRRRIVYNDVLRSRVAHDPSISTTRATDLV
jgi:hypothetical protein